MFFNLFICIQNYRADPGEWRMFEGSLGSGLGNVGAVLANERNLIVFGGSGKRGY